ncbi:hypothetical protein GCM10011487_69190 [Steroidobacter agaridevorans]|uniref:DUF1835 domain-containing protein n=1 Tax=Steroidobacter agaridevorans TaxID=2695856 RepID=A0A829YP41_9GAMM|nr:DUF1835 domain-containing protein [Steroidobacter agaridevorans]GFE84919.1 hypothetical protein GCM10011487_69190 [Steroidobacter agaridevorans]
MADSLGSYSYFRLNFEQQRKRAKELLKAARAGEPAALARFTSPPRLAEAQYLIAQELRFDSWAALKRHIEAMTREHEAVRAQATAPLDGDMRTLHVRCGSDLQGPLHDAGFRGDFYEHNYPYLIGPVREGPKCLEERAHFLVDSYADSRDPPLQYESVLRDLERDEQRLHDSASYDRVVIWSEFDCYDQLVLARLLGHYSTHRRPPRLELINIGEFPGAVRFIGLGQLPPEALRMLWTTRQPATRAMLTLGLNVWCALVAPDPRALASIMRGGTSVLPLLGKALHRHLRELPSRMNGLSFTEQMALQLLAEEEMNLAHLYGRLTYQLDPLPGQGDFQVRNRVLNMEGASARLYERRPGIARNGEARPPWTDVLTITTPGRAVLNGDIDFLSLAPPKRWVGGVEIGPGMPDWRWDEDRKDAVCVDGSKSQRRQKRPRT